ncbi:hypothetical protein S245_044854, partial [Arachis hypogaea]
PHSCTLRSPSSSQVSILFLYALQTYIHSDAQPSTSNGLRDAIRRLSSTPEGPAPDLKKRPKSKDKLNFDEKNAQIFRLRLDHAHLHFAGLDGFWKVLLAAFMGFLSLLYTLWLWVQLHEAVPGKRYNRYVDLAQAVFGERLGVWLALFPTVYLSVGITTALILIGGKTIKLFFQI